MCTERPSSGGICLFKVVLYFYEIKLSSISKNKKIKRTFIPLELQLKGLVECDEPWTDLNSVQVLLCCSSCYNHNLFLRFSRLTIQLHASKVSDKIQMFD